MTDTGAFTEKLFECAKKAGFEACEAYVSQGESFEATLHEGEILSYEAAGNFGLGFRGLLNGKMGYASTQVLDGEAVGQLVEGAAAGANLIECGDKQFLYPGAEKYPAFSVSLTADESARAKIDRALALEKAARSLDPRVTQLQDVAVFSARGAITLVNSLGLNLSFADQSAGLYVAPVARAGDQVNASMKFYLGRDFSGFDPEKLAREAVDEAVGGLGGKPVPSGDYPVILRRDAAASLLRAFSSVFSADAAQKGLSLLAGREGEELAAPRVTLLDDPLRAGSFNACPFDGEGVPTRVKAVIENGRLTTLLHNLKTAAKQGAKTTGNASRPSYAASVGVAPNTLFFAPGAGSLDDLIRDMGRGLLVTDLQGLHAGADAVSGDFSLGAKGFLIENGAIARPVAGVTVAGNFFSLLKTIARVGDETWFTLPGAATFGSPSLLVERLVVAGA